MTAQRHRFDRRQLLLPDQCGEQHGDHGHHRAGHQVAGAEGVRDVAGGQHDADHRADRGADADHRGGQAAAPGRDPVGDDGGEGGLVDVHRDLHQAPDDGDQQDRADLPEQRERAEGGEAAGQGPRVAAAGAVGEQSGQRVEQGGEHGGDAGDQAEAADLPVRVEQFDLGGQQDAADAEVDQVQRGVAEGEHRHQPAVPGGRGRTLGAGSPGADGGVGGGHDRPPGWPQVPCVAGSLGGSPGQARLLLRSASGWADRSGSGRRPGCATQRSTKTE